MLLILQLTLHNDVDRCGSGLAFGLNSAHIESFVTQVYVLNLNGELVTVQGDQADSGIHGPLILTGVEYTGPVQPGCVRHHITLRTTAWERGREREREKEEKTVYTFA